MSSTESQAQASSHVEEPGLKRKRNDSPVIQSEPAGGATPPGSEVAVPIRLITLEVYMKGYDLRENTNIAMLFVPEPIMKMIPKYQSEMQKAMEGQKPGARLNIIDDTHRSQAEVNSLADVIQILSGSSIAEIPGTSLQKPQDSVHLVQTYDQSVELRVKSVEEAILAYVEHSNEMPVATFLDFAKKVFNDDGASWLRKHAVRSSIGEMIIRKLRTLLPAMAKGRTLRKIQCEGGTLSKVLVSVMINELEDQNRITSSAL